MPGNRLLACLVSLMLLGGCASYGEVVNEPLGPGDTQHEYSLKGAQELKRLSGENDAIDLTLAFSGGGTRAVAPTKSCGPMTSKAEECNTPN